MELEAANLPRQLFIEGMGTGRQTWGSQKMQISKQLKANLKREITHQPKKKECGGREAYLKVEKYEAMGLGRSF